MRSLFILFIVLTWSCSSQSQNLNKEITKEGKKPYLLGEVNKEGFLFDNYKEWFLRGYDEYKPNKEVVAKISKRLKDYNILVFMGTWCGDSRREIPRFYKVLESADYPMNQLKVIAVNNTPNMYKQSPNHEEKGLNIHRVPTFIFYKDGKEMNRIVEHPVTILEEDILKILNNNYESNYSIVDDVDKIINNQDFYEKVLAQLEKYKTKAKDIYALNTYSRVLASTNRKDKAIDVLRLNTMLFPNDVKAHMNLANMYFKLNNKKKALASYEVAYKINPANAQLKARIDQIKSELSSANN